MNLAAPKAQHPFHAIAALALARGLPFELVVERAGAYVRLTADKNAILFKRKSDQGDAIDRIRFDRSTRIDLDEATFADDPEIALHSILLALDAARTNPTFAAGPLGRKAGR